ncbi:MAG: peptidoglycan DD-metalloendopeptidase family protein [Pseudanabaenaceae cyanobacterium]
MPVQSPHLQRSLALLGLALVGTGGVCAYSPKDDWQGRTVPMRTDRDDALWKSSQTDGGVYTVQPGDTIEEIAVRLQIPQTELIAHNNLADPNFILVGQQLRIPATAAPELPSFLPTISQEIAQGKRGELVKLAAMFGILPVGGDTPLVPFANEEPPTPATAEVTPEATEQRTAHATPSSQEVQISGVSEQKSAPQLEVVPVVKEEKIAALPVQDIPLPVVGETTPSSGTAAQKAAINSASQGAQISGVSEQKSAPQLEVVPVVKEEKIAALPVQDIPLPVMNEQPVTVVTESDQKVAKAVSDQSSYALPERVAALTTIEIVRRAPSDSLDVPPAVKSPELPPLPKPSATRQSDMAPPPPQKAAKPAVPTLEVPATKVEVKNIYQEVERLRQELYSNQPQKVAALNPDSRTGVKVDPIEFGQPELPSLNATHFLPAPEELPSLEEFDLIWPARGIITSGFGWRWGRLHQGIDIAAPIGTPIWAAGSGVVQFAGWNNGGYGYMVDILHNNGTVTRYAHLNAIYVKVGQRVQQGQVIAEMGSTGYSTGPHLHFEIRPNGGVAVNPMNYLARVPRDRRTAQSRPFATASQR